MVKFETMVEDSVAVIEVLGHLQQQAMAGQYIYRGEPKIYAKVSSSLYRQCEEGEIALNDMEHLGDWYQQIWELQKDIVVQTRRFLPGQQKLDMHERLFWDNPNYSLAWHTESPEYEILCQIQHYGGPTNLIDFTTDYLVALFFACNKHLKKCGRVIFANRYLHLPVRIAEARVQAQRSVFVQPQDGFLNSEQFVHVKIPAKLKVPILMYLNLHHNISSETLYPDIQGAVSYWQSNQSPLFLRSRADKRRLEKKFDEAIEIYDRHLVTELDPQVLLGRAIAKCNLDRWDAAFDDLKKAIVLFEVGWGMRVQSSWGIALYLRGIVFLFKLQWDDALEDFSAAKGKGCDVATEFHKDFGCIADFEKTNELHLPSKIKNVFTNCEASDQGCHVT